MSVELFYTLKSETGKKKPPCSKKQVSCRSRAVLPLRWPIEDREELHDGW